MHQISIFSCGNGDTVLLDAHGVLVLTDVNYRKAAQDGGDDENLDFGPHIRDACAGNQDRLDVFVLTHPDKDHLGGYTDLFHTGRPESWNPRPAYGYPKILVDEIWCSPYALKPNYVTDDAKPVLQEINRRHQLQGTAAGNQPGNRLRVLTAGDQDTLAGGWIGFAVFAPTPDEADIPKKKWYEDNEPSSNPSSLVIEWTVVVDNTPNYILLGGDSTVDIWERIYDDAFNGGRLPVWHALLAPHHCSRYAMGEKHDPASDEFTFSDTAIAALSNKVGQGFVISSSKAIIRNDDDPPSWQAKQRYLKILAGGQQPTDNDKRRFLCTGEAGQRGACGHVVFSLTNAGPILRAGGAKAARGDSAIAAGGGYG